MSATNEKDVSTTIDEPAVQGADESVVEATESSSDQPILTIIFALVVSGFFCYVFGKMINDYRTFLVMVPIAGMFACISFLRDASN